MTEPIDLDAVKEWIEEHWLDPLNDIEARADELLRALVAEVERLRELDNALNWGTSCTNCANLLDRCYAETIRAEAAEQEVNDLKDQLVRGLQGLTADRDRWRADSERLAEALREAFDLDRETPGVSIVFKIDAALRQHDELIGEQ